MLKPQTKQPKKRMEYLPGQMLMRVREDVVRPHLGAGRLAFTALEARRLPDSLSDPIDYLRRNAGLKTVDPLFARRRTLLQRASIASASKHKLAMLSTVAESESESVRGISMLELDPAAATPQLMQKLRSSAAVEFVERMPARWPAAASAVDPMQNMQWGLRAIDYFTAKLPSAAKVRIAVLDTGIDAGHPDLKDIDIAYEHKGLSARDLLGHGTHVAGIIAATSNNAIGITGVAACKLSVWKVFKDKPEDDGEFYVDGARYLRALRALSDAGVAAVNLSLGGTASSQTEAILFRRLQRYNIVVVAAMGNEFEEGNPVEFPGAYEGVLAVGAVAENRRRSRFSNTGKHIGLVAPGSHILSTLPVKASPFLDETEYAAWDGTSMATPHVAGAVALVAAKFPDKKAADIVGHLQKTALRVPAMKKKASTSEYGFGLLNLRKALS